MWSTVHYSARVVRKDACLFPPSHCSLLLYRAFILPYDRDPFLWRKMFRVVVRFGAFIREEFFTRRQRDGRTRVCVCVNYGIGKLRDDST